MDQGKTLGFRTSRLFVGLHDEGRAVFNLSKAATLMGVPRARAAVLVHAAAKRGLVTPIKRGLYNLVPFELGSTSFHLEDRYLLVRESLGDMPYFLSHASALDIHGLATQPNFDVYVTSTRRRKSINLGGSQTHFVWAPESRFFGYAKVRAGTADAVVSDIERTLLDGVSLPGYCGGFIEVAKAFFMAKNRLDSKKLLEYGRRFGKHAVLRRIGFLLELFQLADKLTLDELAGSLPAGYVRLDPDLPAEGASNARWGLKLNVSPSEIENAVSH
jgi:predicted transcriptional regulator of viral defense system